MEVAELANLRRVRDLLDRQYARPLAAVDHHIPPADRQMMREIVAKGDLAVFIQVDDLDKTFESLRAAGAEILQEPIDQPYGVRDAAVRDPSGNHLRLSSPLVARA